MSDQEAMASIHAQFWDELDKHPELDAMLNRLFRVKEVPPERWTDMKNALYCVAAAKFINFDSGRASFSTWMIWWARALLKNYYRNSGGSRSPLSSDLTESDLETLDNGDTPYDAVVSSDPYRDALENRISLWQVLDAYALDLESGDEDLYVAVLATMYLHGWDVPVKVIAEETESNPKLVGDIRQQIFSDLAFRLTRAGWAGIDPIG